MQNKEKVIHLANSLNIFLYDILKVKINIQVYSKASVSICYSCHHIHIKIGMVTFCILIKYSK